MGGFFGTKMKHVSGWYNDILMLAAQRLVFYEHFITKYATHYKH